MKQSQNITIETINGIVFKANTKSSNYYVKNSDGKFIRVKVAEFNDRKNAAIRETATEDYSHFILVDLIMNANIEKCESFELSVRRRQYDRDHVYLSESIARKHGVLFTLTKKRKNGHRLYRFFGNLEIVERTIIEINEKNREIKEMALDRANVRKIILDEIAKNRKIYKNIDSITTSFLKNRGITTLIM